MVGVVDWEIRWYVTVSWVDVNVMLCVTLSILCPQLPDWFDTVFYCAQTLMYSHSAINPIVYGAMNQSFRNGFRHLVARWVWQTNSTSLMPHFPCLLRHWAWLTNSTQLSMFGTALVSVDDVIGVK